MSTRFYGPVGYIESVETAPGIFKEVPTERYYCGNIIRNVRRISALDKVNNDVDIDNRISILADEYSYEHFSKIRYVEWLGTKWRVSSIEVQRPRLILSVSGVYNG